MNHRMILLAGVLLSAGCAYTPDGSETAQALAYWKGRPLVEFIEKNGAPASETTIGDLKAYLWTQREIATSPSMGTWSSTTNPYSNTGTMYASGGTYSMTCDWTLVVDPEGIIQSTSYRGSHCP